MSKPARMIERVGASPQKYQMYAHNKEHRGELWALVPIKQLSLSKQRLNNSLGDDRQKLTEAMLNDVLSALAASQEIDQIAVVTSDPMLAAQIQQRGHLVIQENEPHGLNSAIKTGVEAIRKRGAKTVVVLPADVPLITAEEVDRLVSSYEQQSQADSGMVVGILPSGDRKGTNCLILDAEQAFTFRYGVDSFELHCRSVKSHNGKVISLDSSTVSLDIDEPEDVKAMVAYGLENPDFRHTETWKFLNDAKLITRESSDKVVIK
jgi:2-phospho-L-lactate guanylyltransferase